MPSDVKARWGLQACVTPLQAIQVPFEDRLPTDVLLFGFSKKNGMSAQLPLAKSCYWQHRMTKPQISLAVVGAFFGASYIAHSSTSSASLTKGSSICLIARSPQRMLRPELATLPEPTRSWLKRQRDYSSTYQLPATKASSSFPSFSLLPPLAMLAWSSRILPRTAIPLPSTTFLPRQSL